MGRSVLSSVRGFSTRERALLAELTELGRVPFPAVTAGSHLGVPEPAAEDLLERLTDVSLLEMAGVDETGLPQYRFHEMVLVSARSPAGARC